MPKIKVMFRLKVSDPFMDLESLQEKLSLKYQLKEVSVVYSPTDEYSAIKHYISIKAAEYLNNVVIDGTIIRCQLGFYDL